MNDILKDIVSKIDVEIKTCKKSLKDLRKQRFAAYDFSEKNYIAGLENAVQLQIDTFKKSKSIVKDCFNEEH